jgi:hypothetical protein
MYYGPVVIASFDECNMQDNTNNYHFKNALAKACKKQRKTSFQELLKFEVVTYGQQTLRLL